MDFFYEMFEAYVLMWKNLWGAHYALAIETPKPLIIFLTGIFPQSSNIFIMPILFVLWIWAMARLVKALGCSGWCAMPAVMMCILCNGQTLPYYLPYGFSVWPIVYLPLMFWAGVFFLERRYALLFVCLFFAGLVRPDAWLTAIILLGFLTARKEKMRLIYLLPLFAPVIWSFIDYRISGDIFFSAHITAYYSKVTAFMIKPTSFTAYWLWCFRIIAADFSLIPFLLGVTAFTTRMFQGKRELSHEAVFMASAFAPLICYWFLCLKGSFTIQPRFLAFPVMYMIFYSGVFVDQFYRAKKIGISGAKIAAGGVLVIALIFTHWSDEGWRNGLLRKNNQPCFDAARSFFDSHKNVIDDSKHIVVPVRWFGPMALALGEQTSRRMVTFREVVSGEKHVASGGIVIYFDRETSGFGFLKYLREYNVYVGNRAYKFVPIFSSSEGNCKIYKFQVTEPLKSYMNTTEGVHYEIVDNRPSL